MKLFNTISDVRFDTLEDGIFYQLEGLPDCTYRERRFEKSTQMELDQNKYNL